MSEKQPAKVELARYKDIPRIFQTSKDAFEHDPLYTYLTDTGDADTLVNSFAMFSASLRRTMAYAEYGYYVRYHSAFTVDRGAAFVIIERPKPGKIERIVKRAMDMIHATVNDTRRTPEQRKRWNELSEKLENATKTAFGHNINNMLHVLCLATSPEHQGRGYGSALMAAANAEADRLGCSSWLMSSNIANTTFYESCGFNTVKEILMGDKNPTWSKPPFKILLMSRAARNASSAEIDDNKWSLLLPYA